MQVHRKAHINTLNKNTLGTPMAGNAYTGSLFSLHRTLLSLTLVFTGALVYVLFRSDIIFVNLLAGSHCGPFSEFAAANASSPIHYFIFYCLPDALWYAALLIIQRPFRRYGGVNAALFWLSVALPYILEFAQLLKLLPGTFDIFDIATYIITYLIISLWLKN